MMLITQSCFAVAIFTHTVTAFVPWIPDYRCKEFNTCIGKRANANADAQVDGRGLEHVEIIQRVAENQLPHDVQVQRLAERLYNKYQRDSPSKSIDGRDFKVVPAAAPTTSTSLGIDQDGTDFSYYAKIQVGSNNQVMNMALDTGAGTTWVMGQECQAEACKVHNNFNSSSSTTFNSSTGLDFELHYGSGHVTGKLATDTLTLAGFTIKPIIGVANNASDDFKNFPIDGILGLAQSKGDQDTFIETLAKAKILPANKFGVSIGRASDGPNVGVINFGTLDNTRYSGDLTYFPVPDEKKKEGEWALAMDQISFGGKNINIENKVAYIDTGTSYIFAKETEVKKLHDIVPGANLAENSTATWRVPCDTTTEIVLTFGAKTYTIAPRDWVGPKVDGNCTSNIYGYDVVENAWLLGDTFLKNVYAVFDFDAYQVGLASRPPPPLVVSTTTSGVPTSSPTSATSPSLSGPSGTGIRESVPPSNTLPAESTAIVTDASGATITSMVPPGTGSHGSPPVNSGATAEAITGVASPTPSTLTTTQSAASSLKNVSTHITFAILGLFALLS